MSMGNVRYNIIILLDVIVVDASVSVGNMSWVIKEITSLRVRSQPGPNCSARKSLVTLK